MPNDEEIKKDGENEEKAEETQEKVEEKTEAAPKKPDAAPAAPEKEKKETKKEVSGKFADLVKQIESLSVLELSELVKELEERFGVSAAAPVAVAGSASPVAGGEAEAGEEKTQFSIMLQASGDQRIAVIKAVREIRPDLGLKEAKDLVEAAPKEVKGNVKKDEAEEAKGKLEAAGATVELK